MKYEYFPGTGAAGVQLILRATSPEDQRFLTYLRNYTMGKDKPSIRVTGSEHVDANVPGLPDRPVLALSMTFEMPSGEPWIPAPGETVDPNVRVRTESSPGHARRGASSVHRGSDPSKEIVTR